MGDTTIQWTIDMLPALKDGDSRFAESSLCQFLHGLTPPVRRPITFYLFLVRLARNIGGIDLSFTPLRMLHWVICGGESGPGARPFEVDWARSVIAQCKAADVACFVKQVGRYPNGSGFPQGFDYRKRDRKGGTMEEWPEDIRIRQFPEARA